MHCPRPTGKLGTGGLQEGDFSLCTDRTTTSPQAHSPVSFSLTWSAHGVINQTAAPTERLDTRDQRKHTKNQKINLSNTTPPPPLFSSSCLILYSQPPELAEIAFSFEIGYLPGGRKDTWEHQALLCFTKSGTDWESGFHSPALHPTALVYLRKYH